MQHSAGRYQQLAYLTASEIVWLAEMLGSTMIVGCVEDTTATGSARLLDMTVHHHQTCMLDCFAEPLS